MPPTTAPGRLAFPAQIAALEDQLRAQQTQQLHVINDPTEASGDPAHGHATVVLGPLKAITGISGYGLAVYASGAWHQVTGSGGGGGITEGEVLALIESHAYAKATGEALATEVTAIEGEVDALQTEMAAAATKAEVEAVEGEVDTLQTEMAEAIKSGTAAGGDLEGTYPNPTLQAGTVTTTEAPEMVTLATEQTISGHKILTAGLEVTGTQPVSVGTGTGTAATAATALAKLTGAKGGETTIATTGVGGVGAKVTLDGGPGGEANSAATHSTGGKGGVHESVGGVGGAAKTTGTTRTGGAGGEGHFGGGAGGAAEGGTTNVGGAGGKGLFSGGAGAKESGAGGTAELIGGFGATPNGNGGEVKIRGGKPQGTGEGGRVELLTPEGARAAFLNAAGTLFQWEIEVAFGNTVTFASPGTVFKGLAIETEQPIEGEVADTEVTRVLHSTAHFTHGGAGAHVIARHDYWYIDNPTVDAEVTLTDAAVMRFNAAAGTHKAVDGETTKTTPGAVKAWVKININGTIYYMPAYLSKTA